MHVYVAGKVNTGTASIYIPKADVYVGGDLYPPARIRATTSTMALRRSGRTEQQPITAMELYVAASQHRRFGRKHLCCRQNADRRWIPGRLLENGLLTVLPPGDVTGQAIVVTQQ